MENTTEEDFVEFMKDLDWFIKKHSGKNFVYIMRTVNILAVLNVLILSASTNKFNKLYDEVVKFFAKEGMDLNAK